MHAVTGKEIIKSRLGKAAFHRNKHGLVVFITVLIDHDQDLADVREDVKREAADEFRVLQGNMRWQKRLRHTAAIVHGIQAQMPGKIAQKIDALTCKLWEDEQPGREQGLDTRRHKTLPFMQKG